MAWRFLLLFLIHDALSIITCPENYFDDGNGNCQSKRQDSANQFTAYRACATRNAYLITMRNAFENSEGIHLAGDFDNIWLGLTCTDNARNSCRWDDGTQVTENTYTNFYPGHPNINLGACVYLSAAKGGYWYSASCNDFQAPFVCRATPGVFVPLCIGDSNYFRGHCYYPVRAIGYNDAETNCHQSYGELTSVHNLGENSFVRDVAVSKPYLSNSTSVYTYLGLTINSDLWSDNTTIDLKNFGYENPNLGQCVFLSTTADAVPKGKWINGDCASNTVGVCKRNISTFPKSCSADSYLDGNGTLYSPNNPSVNQSIHCEYVFNPDLGSIVSFSFVAMSLDVGSSIKLYNTIFDKSPFATFSNVQMNNWTYYSQGNVQNPAVVYDSPANGFYHDYFIAHYETQKQGTNNCGGLYDKTGRISGPDSARNCTYSITLGQATVDWTCIKFINIGLQGKDTITIYDGEISPDHQVGFIAKDFQFGATSLALCSFASNTLHVVTTGVSGLDYDMFVLDAALNWDQLHPTTIYSYNAYDDRISVPDTGRNSSVLYDTQTRSRVEMYTMDANPYLPIRVNFTYLNMPFPQNNIVILDGGPDGVAAVAYGLGGPDFQRRAFPYTKAGYMTVCCQFGQTVSTGQMIGYVGEFTHK